MFSQRRRQRVAANWLGQPPLSIMPDPLRRCMMSRRALIQPTRNPGASDLENEPRHTTGASGPALDRDGGAGPS